MYVSLSLVKPDVMFLLGFGIVIDLRGGRNLSDRDFDRDLCESPNLEIQRIKAAEFR